MSYNKLSPPGFAESSGVSWGCHGGCLTCSAANGCLSCKPRFFFFLERSGMRQVGVCVSSCPSGYYGTRSRSPDMNKCTSKLWLSYTCGWLGEVPPLGSIITGSDAAAFNASGDESHRDRPLLNQITKCQLSTATNEFSLQNSYLPSCLPATSRSHECTASTVPTDSYSPSIPATCHLICLYLAFRLMRDLCVPWVCPPPPTPHTMWLSFRSLQSADCQTVTPASTRTSACVAKKDTTCIMASVTWPAPRASPPAACRGSVSTVSVHPGADASAAQVCFARLDALSKGLSCSICGWVLEQGQGGIEIACFC